MRGKLPDINLRKSILNVLLRGIKTDQEISKEIGKYSVISTLRRLKREKLVNFRKPNYRSQKWYLTKKGEGYLFSLR